MKIEQLKIINYKVFKDIEIRDLPNMCVFLGANGSGKSTLFDVFGFLCFAVFNYRINYFAGKRLRTKFTLCNRIIQLCQPFKSSVRPLLDF